MDRKKSNIITMANLKGGVGKSTLSILFSYVLKYLGKKVLLIDMDSQNAVTSYFRKYVFNFGKNNIYNLLIGNAYFDQCVYKINDFISIIPSHPSLDEFNYENMDNKENLLSFCLDKNILNYNFDYILIDTPPSFSFILKNALNVTNHIVIPVQPETWSIESLEILIQKIIDKSYNISIVVNQFIKNRNILKEVEDALYMRYSNYIKGKIHYYNSIKVFIINRLEPDLKSKYYKESKNVLKNILNL
ncbi:Cellulose biosynthesis protein BcsQ [Borreliella japonica]|uniref:Cellulose biosynthesis protein BcsQ n=1 Tax=Borreliella japonica TaxID=34095 RepID=A0A1G4QEW6_BORJA|nr:ParA family protein [Borreliella japonica]SCW43116.1 Cellulose biosynthesis protein BcsQ [Borreliella japonica]